MLPSERARAGLGAGILLACLLTGCGGGAASRPGRSSVPVGTPRAAAGATRSELSPTPGGRVVGWRRDLESLLPGMAAIHPNLYHGAPQAEVRADVRALESAAPTLNDDQMMVGLLKVVGRISAKGRDGHTGAFIWGTGSRQIHSLPLRLWLFPDGMYVVDALPPYRPLVGSRVESVDGHATIALLRALDPVVPRDNASTVLLLTPRYLLIPEVLHGLGLTDGVGAEELAVTDRKGERRSVTVEPIRMTDYNRWAGVYGLHLPPRPGALYLSRTEEPLWFTFLRSSGTLYVQYNRVDWLPDSLLDRLKRRATRPDVRRMVVDLRHNFGGETHASQPVLDVLTAPGVGRDHPFFVITGRNTFSAAALFAAELERARGAVFVGEPMGGSPNFFGDSEELSLPWSGITVSVATQYFVGSRADDLRLTIQPDIPIRCSSADYFADRDPALDAILAKGE